MGVLCQEIPVCGWCLELFTCLLSLWSLNELVLFINLCSPAEMFLCSMNVQFGTDTSIPSTTPMGGKSSQHLQLIWMLLKSENIRNQTPFLNYQDTPPWSPCSPNSPAIPQDLELSLQNAHHSRVSKKFQLYEQQQFLQVLKLMLFL